jgi:hypothetical protein
VAAGADQVTPFDSLALPFSMAERLRIAAATAAQKLSLFADPLPLPHRAPEDARRASRLRIAYAAAPCAHTRCAARVQTLHMRRSAQAAVHRRNTK